MVLWLLGLPFAFVVTLGWWSIIVCTVVGYGELLMTGSRLSTVSVKHSPVYGLL